MDRDDYLGGNCLFGQLVKPLASWTETQALLRVLRQKEGTQVQGISGAQRSFLLACLWQQLDQSMLVITNTPSEAERLAADLEMLLGPDSTLLFPACDLLAHEEAYEKDVAGERLAVLCHLME